MLSTSSLIGRPLLRTTPVRSLQSRNRLSTARHALYLRPTGNGDTSHLDDESATLTPPFLLLPGQHMVGRTDESNVCIPIATVSTRHAMLIVDEEGGAAVTDLQSTNGTVVDGRDLEALKPCELHTGSDLIFGDSSLARFSVELRPEPTRSMEEELQEEDLSMAGLALVASELAEGGEAGADVEERAPAVAVEHEHQHKNEQGHEHGEGQGQGEADDGDWQESWPSNTGDVHYAIAPEYTAQSADDADPITGLFEAQGAEASAPHSHDHDHDHAAEAGDGVAQDVTVVQDSSQVAEAQGVSAAGAEEIDTGADSAPADNSGSDAVTADSGGDGDSGGGGDSAGSD